MTKRTQPKLARDREGYEERIRRANTRTKNALQATLAQNGAVVKMGTTLRLDQRFDPESPEEAQMELSIGLVDREKLAYLATQLRPFVLAKEAIYYVDLVEGLRLFAGTESDRVMVEQLNTLWEKCSNSRMTVHVSNPREGQLIPGGAGSARIADRVLYSQVVHADDASDILDHMPDEWQQWSLSTLVGDWAAIAAHQQYVMHCVRPDLVPELTNWAGDYLTIFHRFGLDVKRMTE